MSKNKIFEEKDAFLLSQKLDKQLSQWEKLPTREITAERIETRDHSVSGDVCSDWKHLWKTTVKHSLRHEDTVSTGVLAQIDSLFKAPNIHPENLLPLARSLWSHQHELDTKAEKIRQGLQELLQLLLRNVADLLDNDAFLSGQLDVVQLAVQSAQNDQELELAINGVKEVIFQQGKLKSEVREAREAIRDLVNLVLISVESMAGEDGRNHQQLESLANELESAKDWQQIRQIVSAVVSTSKKITRQSAETRNALLQAKNRLHSAQEKIRKLEDELESISQLVHVDPLTGLLNRRGLKAAFARESARAQRQNQPLAVAIVDLDHFKQVNDQYGHDLGDRVLQGMARILQNTLRANDVITRYGGEEFVLLMPETSAEEAKRILERLQLLLGQQLFETRDKPLQVSFSAGVTCWQKNSSQEQMIAEADQAMYRAKKAGRKRIFMADQANSST
ncbi:hypothetical protein B1757_05665 [Acidithiobacillus marinus]|uniref:diguanylate cyclase n=1 Tax=Acidithiobacillus marinus TaxID=187490 RepID=A0A2I1DN28_9PROT|nr:GGDEF domain-containing protein [Acidithiobacillus marinus]PKY11272.1 hypothetical protein B1757_05665 [Acidithiobacillus marinus]